jgi:hypothetical protein
LTHCSIDNKSGIWIDRKNPSREAELSRIDFDKKLKYEEFKDNVVLFSKQSKYPNLMKK